MKTLCSHCPEICLDFTAFITPSDKPRSGLIVSPLSTFSHELFNQHCTKCLLDGEQFFYNSGEQFNLSHVLISLVQVEGTLITDKPVAAASSALGVHGIPYIYHLCPSLVLWHWISVLENSSYEVTSEICHLICPWEVMSTFSSWQFRYCTI